MNKYILWDFDGTLGGRYDGLHGRAWSMSMLEAVQQLAPTRHMTLDMIAPHLREGFPWHEPDKPHLHLHTSELWWAHIRGVFASIFRKLQFPDDEAHALAELSQLRFVDMDRWVLYDDSIPVLDQLMQQGWQHVIVSNHVPELPEIVEHLGLMPYVKDIVNSAEIGYEKPNPKIYEAALTKTKNASEIWMVGDNPVADVWGAEQAGIQAILVRNSDADTTREAKVSFADLYGVGRFLEERQSR